MSNGYNYNAYPWGRWIKWGALVLVLIILVSSAVSNYNGLVSADQNVQTTWSQVENNMQERADKITSLVEVVKGYTKHEEAVFGDIAAARSELMNSSGDIESKLAADDKLQAAEKSVLLLVENYPDLQASQQFSDLQVAIEGQENRLSVARRDFILAVEKYNVKVKRFPGNIYARLMGFGPKDYFEASPGAENAPEISF